MWGHWGDRQIGIAGLQQLKKVKKNSATDNESSPLLLWKRSVGVYRTVSTSPFTASSG